MDKKEKLEAELTKRTALREMTTFSGKLEVTKQTERILATPFEKSEIRTMYSVAKKILERKMSHPLMAVFYPSYLCNHNCQGCSCQELNREENVFFDPQNLLKLLKSLSSLEVKSIEFSGGGEPTLHPKFGELVEKAIDEGFELGLSTNGSLLSGRIADLVVDHFTYIRVNVDASDMLVYNQMHDPPEIYSFQTLLKNLEEVIFKKNQKNSKLIVGSTVLICQTNMNFIEDVINLTKDVGCDYIQFKPKCNAKDSLFPEQVNIVDDLIRSLQEKYHPFLVCGGANSTKTSRKCWISPIHLVVDPLGDVYPCCHYQYRRESTLMGNLFKQPLEKIWFGRRHVQVIRNLKVEGCNLCNCRCHYYTEIMWQLTKDNKMHLNLI
jgi:radical SAM protein with 4Fe4S-binding SPASM domain